MFVRSPETIFIMDEELEKKLFPEVYAEKLKEFKKVLILPLVHVLSVCRWKISPKRSEETPEVFRSFFCAYLDPSLVGLAGCSVM